MTINDWLTAATKQLNKTGIGTAQLDALILLEDELHTNRAQLLAQPERQLTNEQQLRLAKQLRRRAKHEPLAYIRGQAEFYGRSFTVNNHVLQPRPETETMIELLKQLPKANQQTVVDVGTGSGAIIITAALELHEGLFYATDVDPACLKVARANAKKHWTTVNFKQTHLLEGLDLAKATILANLPYVPDAHTINPAAMHEPGLAIFGGPDGLDLYRQLFEQLKSAQHRGYVLTESLPPQHSALAKIADDSGYKLQTSDDFIQVFNFAARRPA